MAFCKHLGLKISMDTNILVLRHQWLLRRKLCFMVCRWKIHSFTKLLTETDSLSLVSIFLNSAKAYGAFTMKLIKF